MTYLELAKQFHPELAEHCIVEMFCPADLIPNCDIEPATQKEACGDMTVPCQDCWNQEAKDELDQH